MDGVCFFTGPEAPETVYGSVFFPWLEPVPLAAGQRVCVELEAKHLENDYFWRWMTRNESPRKNRRAGEMLRAVATSGGGSFQGEAPQIGL